MDEFQILNFSDAMRLWNLSRSGAEEIIAKAKAETDGIIQVAKAESAEIIEGIQARTDAERLLKGPPVPSEFEQKRILQELKDKQESLAGRVRSARETAAEKLQSAKREIELKKRSSVKARLMNPKDSSSANTWAAPPETRYYAIIGRGTAAVLNHTTLRQTTVGQDRLKDPKDTSKKLPVIHVGLTDPWFLYQAHGMGQPRHLLVLPGYHYRPSCLDRTIRSGMHSWDFAFKTLQEWALLKMKYGFDHLEGWVALIQKKGEESADWVAPDLWNEEGVTGVRDQLKVEWKKAFVAESAYRLLVVLPNASIVHVYAEKVDICTGAGRAALQPATPHHQNTDTLKEGCPRLWEPPEQWTDKIKNRKVLTGPEALFMVTPWNAAHRYYVNGAGGIGLNMIERAEDEGCAMDWLHYQLLHQNSFGLARNDTVLKHRTEDRPCEPGESGLRKADASMKDRSALERDTLLNLYPARPQWRFGRTATPDYARIVASGMTKVKIPITANLDCKIHDHFGQEVALANGAFPFSPAYASANGALSGDEAREGIYDRLICTGGLMGAALGTPECMAADARFSFSEKTMDGVAVALEADGGAVRIMGGAVTIHAKFPTLVLQRDSETKTRFLQLPVSAVPPGFIFSGLNIATANGWFADQPNTNANTATRDEIKNDLVGKGVASDLADAMARAVINKRRVANGFESHFDLMKALETDAELVKKSGWLSAAFNLDLTYREAGKFLD